MQKYNTFGKNKGGSGYQDKRGGGGRSGGGRSGGFGGGQTQMHPATCAGCKQQTEVPFKPNGEKPVYCRDCFGSQNNDRDRGGNDRDRGGRNDFRGNDRAPKKTYSEGFQPRQSDGTAEGLVRLEKQLVGIYTKLDQILKALTGDAVKFDESGRKKEIQRPEVVTEDIKEALDAITQSKKKPAAKKVVKKKTPAKKAAAKKKVSKKKA